MPVKGSSASSLKQKTLFSFLTPKDGPKAAPAAPPKAVPAPPAKVVSKDVPKEAPTEAPSSPEIQALPVKRHKRKVIIDDSDQDEDVPVLAETLKSAPAARNARSAKRRRSSPATSRTAYEDEFVPSDPATEDDDGDTFAPDEEEFEDVEAPKKGKAQKKSGGAAKSARPSIKPVQRSSSPDHGSGGTGVHGSSDQFLTAAEKRTRDTKSAKKSHEECFDFLKDVRDKEGRRPTEEGYDPRTIFIPKSAWASFTPFEKQFWEIKQNHYDTVLMFQKGKFYELYEEDAEIGHNEFDLKLTDRVKMKMVGVPESSFNFWAAKFLAKGYKVGRVDQAETSLGAEMRVAKHGNSAGGTGKEIVRRELNKVLTNGTLTEPELMVDDEAGHCISIKEGDNNVFGVCTLDAGTGEFNLCTFEDDVCRTRLETLMRQLRPKELVHCAGNLSIATTRLLKSILSGSCAWTTLKPDIEAWSYDRTLRELVSLYPPPESREEEDTSIAREEGDSSIVNGQDITGLPEAIRSVVTETIAIESLGGLIWYLGQLNVGKDLLGMRNFNIYDPMRRGMGLVLDGQTLAHVEVLVNSEGTDDGSLLKILNRCVTPFGKRLFRIWLCMPLREVEAINQRLDAVEDLIAHPTFEGSFHEVTKGLPDLERVISRVHGKTCKAKDFDGLLRALACVQQGVRKLSQEAEDFPSSSVRDLLRTTPDLSPHLKNVQRMFELKEDVIYPVPGADASSEEVSAEIGGLERKLDKELSKLKSALGETSLKYWHSALGTKEIYTVEAPVVFKGIPKGWTKTGGTKSVTRWQVPELMATIRKLKEARETLKECIKQYRFRVFEEFDTDRDTWLRAVKVIAELDCLFSLAKSSLALGEPSCRPVLVDSDDAFVYFKELRHPAFFSDKPFIPNDVRLGGDREKIMLLTGPNMGGKSTAMRMTAAGVIMAQLGMRVPAREARIAPVDAILTRMGAYDNMFTNASTFKVELDECCKILREATPRSLVILDELGRGTSTFDGMAIAGAVLHHLATHTLALSCFATHYSSLTETRHPNIRNMHMGTTVNEEERQLVFLYELVDGVSPSSFGTHVAGLAGVPAPVITRAEQVSNQFASQFAQKVASRQKSSFPIDVLADFSYLYKVATGSAVLDAEPVRSRQVLDIIQRTAALYIQ